MSTSRKVSRDTTPTPRHGVATPTPTPVPGPLPAPRSDDEPTPTKGPKRPRAITPDWEPSPGQVAQIAHKLTVSPRDVEARIEGFRDFWLGNAKPKADWDATFRTWIRREVHDGKLERIVHQPAPEPEKPDTRTPEEIQAGKDWFADCVVAMEQGLPIPAAPKRGGS